jgi:polysaccharide deacetylase 2 family uncharacterized protein YibQ
LIVRKSALGFLLTAALLRVVPLAGADGAVGVESSSTPAVAIIIDDLGYRGIEGKRILELPAQVTVSILPHSPFGRQLAEGAHARGMEVMLHLPLQPADDNFDAGPGVIGLDTGSNELARALEDDLLSVPYVVGVNNHMGSLLTRHPGHMTWLMRELDRQHLFFVDSFTTDRSVAVQMAREVGVPAIKRHVFLDSDPDPVAISAEFDRLIELARAQGYAVAIGHPYTSTLGVLERRLPELSRDGIRLVPASQLINIADGTQR